MKKIHIFAWFVGKYIKKYDFFIIPRNGSFSGLNFYIQDVEIEPPLLKEILPWCSIVYPIIYFGQVCSIMHSTKIQNAF